MILLTGAVGFIGSCLLQHLNELDYTDIVLVDNFQDGEKLKNIKGKKFKQIVHRDQLFDWLEIHKKKIDFVFHLGARTDTTEQNRRIFDELNLSYSKRIWTFCSLYQIPLVYASSAATYGLGEHGFVDTHLDVKKLKPLNPYGDSKHEFDKWALVQKNTPPHWIGLKFFNVYGPNEYHKGRMASVVFHTVQQIRKTRSMKLFRSHRPDVENGQQSRDFIYVKDVVQICAFFLSSKPNNGLYNVGTGTARPFWDLASNTFDAMNLSPDISFIDTPLDIRSTYQYFTQADMSKLLAAGYDQPFYSLEKGIEEYVQLYLLKKMYY